MVSELSDAAEMKFFDADVFIILIEVASVPQNVTLLDPKIVTVHFNGTL